MYSYVTVPIIRIIVRACVPCGIQVHGNSLGYGTVIVKHREFSGESPLTSLPRPHYTHSPSDTESASNLALPS